MTYEELNDEVIKIQDEIFPASPSTLDQRIRYEHRLQQLLAEAGWTLEEYCRVGEQKSLESLRELLRNFNDLRRALGDSQHEGDAQHEV
jgi:hypothetical protein